MATENWTYVTVQGQYLRLDGTPVRGRVIFIPQADRYVDQTALVTVTGRAFIAQLDNTGSFTIELPATNDPNIVPTNFTYSVKEIFTGGRQFSMSAPVSAEPAGLDITQVAPIDPSGGEVEVTVVAHQHPISDIATLQTQLDAKAPTVHTHAISSVTGLQAALDAAAESGGDGATLEVDDPSLTGITLRAGFALPLPDQAPNTIYYLLPSPE